MKKIGITTTVPQEILLAAGYTPVDMNNLFITSEEYLSYIESAEEAGFPKSMCAWIKGIFGACLKHKIGEIVGVVEGDCSNTHSLIAVLKRYGIKVHSFGYPHSQSKDMLYSAMNTLAESLGTTLSKAEKFLKKTSAMHALAQKLDILTVEGKVTGFENHLWQVSQSDFNSNIKKYSEELSLVISTAERRIPNSDFIRLGYIGVPPMTGDIYEFSSTQGAEIIFNEVQREFAFPRFEKYTSLTEKYLDFTYPYCIDGRISEIKKNIQARRLDGIIHYTQAFCHRAVEDIIFKAELGVPVLHIEGDRYNSIDARTKLRLETFIDMLKDKKRGI